MDTGTAHTSLLQVPKLVVVYSYPETSGVILSFIHSFKWVLIQVAILNKKNSQANKVCPIQTQSRILLCRRLLNLHLQVIYDAQKLPK